MKMEQQKINEFELNAFEEEGNFVMNELALDMMSNEFFNELTGGL